MNTEKIILSTSEEDTEEVGFNLAQSLPRGSVVLLYGNLGAGKTVFARGFARGLGVEDSVSSPTYTIAQEYPIEGGRLYHLDLYRISDEEAGLAFGVDEFLDDKKSYSLLEWPDRIKGLLPDTVTKVELTHLEEGKREIKITHVC